jgi:phage gpG-like protein
VLRRGDSPGLLGQRLLKFTRPRFDPLAVKLRQVQSGRLRQAAAGAIRDTVEILIDEQFDARAEPTSGDQWAPRVPPTGSWPILEKTGRMRRSYHVSATTTGVTVTNSTDYAGFHQTGTARMVARKVLPDGDLPGEWRARIDEAVEAELERVL